MSNKEEKKQALKSAPVFSFGRRTRAMASSGWEAYTVGFVLVACILACSALGWWLDNYLGTSYWLPILFLVGVAAGFRELLLTVSRLNALEKKRKESRQVVESPLLSGQPKRDEEPVALQVGSISIPAPPTGKRAPTQPPGESVPVPRENDGEVVEDIQAFARRLIEENQKTIDVGDRTPGEKDGRNGTKK